MYLLGLPVFTRVRSIFVKTKVVKTVFPKFRVPARTAELDAVCYPVELNMRSCYQNIFRILAHVSSSPMHTHDVRKLFFVEKSKIDKTGIGVSQDVQIWCAPFCAHTHGVQIRGVFFFDLGGVQICFFFEIGVRIWFA